MLGSLLHKPLAIEVAGRTLRFDSKAELEFALSSRTEVPTARITELMRFDAEQLIAEASRIRHVERHFVDVLSRSIQEPGSIGYLLREIDMKMFSQDHDWRDIIQALARQPARHDVYKQLALVKYMQYLTSRQDVLKGIYAFRASAGLTGHGAETEGETQLRETVIFDLGDPLPLSPGHDAGTGAGALTRLPRGEEVTVEVAPDAGLEIILSRHPFTLRLGDAPAVVAEDGRAQSLGAGRNVLGRHPDSNVMIDATFRDVSRTHLLVDVISPTCARLTDLSSHGTFVPAGHLRPASAD